MGQQQNRGSSALHKGHQQRMCSGLNQASQKSLLKAVIEHSAAI
jgi:hypothetical protein